MEQIFVMMAPYLTLSYLLDLVIWMAPGLPPTALILLQIRRARKEKSAFAAGDMRGVVLVSTTMFEQAEDGLWSMKPRDIVHPEPVREIFVDPVLSEKVLKKARLCDPRDPKKAVVVLDDEHSQELFKKAIVSRCSEEGKDGHLRRSAGLPVITEDFYACLSVAQEGRLLRLRVDLIHWKNLERFVNPDFRKELKFRQGEGSHDDMAAVFENGAQEIFVSSRSSPRFHRVGLSFKP